MTGTLAQIIALVSYGNAYLEKGEIGESFSDTNSTFTFCNKVDFRTFTKGFLSKTPKEEVVADNPEEWFAYMKQSGCRKLALYYQSSEDQGLAKDHQLAGFIGGGGTWYIEAVYDKYSNYWASRWEVTRKGAEDNRIWSVSYGMVSGKQATHDLLIDREITKEKLGETLEDIAAFAKSRELGNWAAIFERATAALDSPVPGESYYHKDLFPEGHYDLLSQQLLSGAGSAWVFGGMGSWNDLGFDNDEDNHRYNALSGKLYSMINMSIVAGVNSRQ
ncbi:hypothetical protein OGH69_06255 [Flavobacterium sp. MFBS3-15]|uniref:hypothetical protein n=1 Tax=Flavobacterium sp. MFBS3-15 TaxID=2989816 RepID=UPI002235FC0E|nr:hypothetical protein [Flavobacterium sp. MFBS3-15]MCW4468556.1 hypothetical protein [Flavobacterium sp. MFBS3-15]